MTDFVTTHELQKAFGITRVANLKKALSKNKVKYFEDRLGKPFTTPEALSIALGIDSAPAGDTGFNIDHLK